MVYDFLKRLLDIVVALCILIFFLPIFLIVPILIKIDSPGPVFADIPKRVGKDRKLFRMYKFRSMIANAHRLLKTDPKLRQLYQDYKKNSYKLKVDPRITKVGHFLRRFSLDELPQVFNVLKGEMSVVGPRAYYADELRDQQRVYPQSKEHIRKLLRVKPGMTGFWQVGGRSEVNFDKRVKMDADYAGERSLIHDSVIILKTPWAMISGKGAI